MNGLTLDASALTALERGNRAVRLLLARADETRQPVTVPATVVAQVVCSPRTQVGVMRLLAASSTDVADLDRVTATAVGRLLAASGTSDITDAHVVVTARLADQTAVTSGPDDLRRLDPTLPIEAV